jgi:hypothetical protein
MVFGQVQQFYSPELDESSKSRIKIPVETTAGAHYGAMLVRREAFWRVGSFRTDVLMGDFVDWHARAVELGLKSISQPDIVMKRRIHLTNLGILHRDARRDYLRVLKTVLDRRRTINRA